MTAGPLSGHVPFVENAAGVEPPGLRTLQKFCSPFRLELRQSSLTETNSPETPPGLRMQIGRRCLRGPGKVKSGLVRQLPFGWGRVS